MRAIDEEQIEIIRRIYSTGNLEEVAETAECCVATVVKYAKRMGLRKTRSPKTELESKKGEKLACFSRLVEDGMSYAQAARSMGVSRKTGADWVRRLGLRTQGRHRITEEEGEEIIRLAKNMPYVAIAKRIGCSYAAVYKYVRKMNPEVACEHSEKYARGLKGNIKWTPEQKAKAVKRRKEVYHKDRLRWLNGLPQRTRWKFSCQENRKREQRRRLRLKGYLEDRDDKSLFHITSATMRSKRMERNAKEKYKIRFINAEADKTGDAHSGAGLGQ